MKKGLIILLVVFMLTACATPNQIPTQDADVIFKTAEAAAWLSITQTAAALPTFTPTIALTPTATATPLPTVTNTPPTAPVALIGTGDSVVDVILDGPGFAHIKHIGGSNFAVHNYDANNNKINLLVNTIGNYEGNVPIDFLDNEHTARFQITAGGQWEITIYPLSELRAFELPALITGTGDDVVRLRGGNADLIKADNQGSSNFAIWSYGPNGRDLVFNEIAPYTGTSLLDKETFVLVIVAEGNWSLEITKK